MTDYEIRKRNEVAGMTLWKGNYLGEAQRSESGWDYVTIVEFVGDLGECKVRLCTENELPFKPDWYSMSLRGYHQAAQIPEEYALWHLFNFSDPDSYRRMWNARLPENGAVSLHASMDARDAYLKGDG